MNKKVIYKNWMFEVDFDTTIQTYLQIEKGGDAKCACSKCTNFLANKENIFPDEVKCFLANLAIDYKKVVEVYHLGKMENGKHYYGGWFHFKGKILNMESMGEAIEIASDFKIKFSQKSDLSFFDKNENPNLIQIDFYTYSDWIIDKKLENG